MLSTLAGGRNEGGFGFSWDVVVEMFFEKAERSDAI